MALRKDLLGPVYRWGCAGSAAGGWCQTAAMQFDRVAKGQRGNKPSTQCVRLPKKKIVDVTAEVLANI